MPTKLSIPVLQTRRDARLNQLAKIGPVLQGCLVHKRVTCGNPNCRCARGEKHQAWQLTKKVRGTTKSCYVPVDMVDEVRQWLAEGRRVKRLLQEISALNEQLLRAHVPTRRERAARAAAAPHPPPTSPTTPLLL